VHEGQTGRVVFWMVLIGLAGTQQDKMWDAHARAERTAESPGHRDMPEAKVSKLGVAGVLYSDLNYYLDLDVDFVARVKLGNVLLQSELENGAVWVTPIEEPRRRTFQCRSNGGVSAGLTRWPFCGST